MPFWTRKTVRSQRAKPPLDVAFTVPPVDRRFSSFNEISAETKKFKNLIHRNSKATRSRNIRRVSQRTGNQGADYDYTTTSTADENNGQAISRCDSDGFPIISQPFNEQNFNDSNEGIVASRQESLDMFELSGTVGNHRMQDYDDEIIYATPEENYESNAESGQLLSGENLLDFSHHRFIDDALMLPPRQMPGYQLNVAIRQEQKRRRSQSQAASGSQVQYTSTNTDHSPSNS